MSKTDTLFCRILQDDNLCKEYEIPNASSIQSITEGLRSSNRYVKTIATLVEQLDKVVEAQKMEMRLKKKEGPVVLTESEKKSIYRKMLTQLQIAIK